MKKRYFPILALIIYVIIYICLTYFLYTDDRPADGPLSLGISFPFYYGGGFCLPSCGPYFQPTGFAIDLLVFLLPIAVYLIVKRKKRNV